MIDREISSYKIVNLIGRGGMGEVYKAQHPYIGKQVAIKLLKAEHAADTEVVQRFFQEAKSVNNIRHENVIDVLDFGKTQEGEYFIIMELLEGRTLSQALTKEAPFDPKKTANIGLQICSALHAAHENGIIHRDLKSDNIFLITRGGKKDFVKVLDFGIAKLMNDPSGAAHTTTGMVMGTPLYMAPEQALGRTLDAQTDVYALGVILFQMATGTVPFFDPNPVALATMHVTAPVPKPSKFFTVEVGLEKVIMKCLEKEKKDRFLSMKEVAAALASACQVDASGYFSDLAGGSKIEKVEAAVTKPTPRVARPETPTTAPQRSLATLYASAAALVVAAGIIFVTQSKKAEPPAAQPAITAPETQPTQEISPQTLLAQSQPTSTPTNIQEAATTAPSKPNPLKPKPESKPKPETKPESKPEVKVETKPETKPPEKKPKVAGDGVIGSPF